MLTACSARRACWLHALGPLTMMHEEHSLHCSEVTWAWRQDGAGMGGTWSINALVSTLVSGKGTLLRHLPEHRASVQMLRGHVDISMCKSSLPVSCPHFLRLSGLYCWFAGALHIFWTSPLLGTVLQCSPIYSSTVHFVLSWVSL